MQPQQPYPQPPQYPPQPAPGPANGGNQNNYDFILNPEKPVKKSPFSFGGGPKLGKLVLIIGGIFVVVIILAVVMSMTKNSGLDKPAMMEIAQDQAEILRLVEYGTKNAKSQSLANFNATASASTASDQVSFITYTSSNGLKISSKDLTLTQDVQTDTQLTNAVSAGTFDTTYKNVMEKKLSEYQADLTAAYKNAGPKGKTILKTQYNNAKLLQTQLNS